MRQDDAFAILEFFDQADDPEGCFDRGNFANKSPGDADFFRSLRVGHDYVGPVSAAQDPLVMLHTNDSRIERKPAVA